jgi:hypothetical protein
MAQPPLEELDPEVRALVTALNELPGVRTEGSCSGHGKQPLRVNLVVDDYHGEGLWVLSRLLCPRYSGLWRHFRLDMDHIDVAPWVVWDLASKKKGEKAYAAALVCAQEIRAALRRGEWRCTVREPL